MIGGGRVPKGGGRPKKKALMVMLGLSWVMLVVGQLAWATEKTAPQWLDEMSRGFKDRNYKGRFIYLNGAQINTLQIFHKVKDGEEFERLRRLSGEDGDIIRRGHEVHCVHPADHFVRLQESVPSGAFAAKFREGKAGFESAYHLRLGAQGKVAGRPAQQILVTAKDEFRYDYELWVDRESAFLLKSVLRGGGGEALEVFEFVELQLDVALEDSLFEFRPGEAALEAAHGDAHVDPSPREAGWGVSWNPQGFTLASREVRHSRQVGRSSMEVLMYADGLATYTVFVEAVGGNQTLGEAVKRDGATVAYSQPMTACDLHRVTVVGELPLTTIKRIASSVTRTVNAVKEGVDGGNHGR